MKAEDLAHIIGSDFYAGVPDSQLRALCDYLMDEYGIDSRHHIIAANEGNCVGLAAGYYLATGKIPAVYLQNSGEGNIINPLASLISRDVYAIPCVFIIGWRGEPGVHDEPQHVCQGKVTNTLLETMGVPYMIVGKDTDTEEVRRWFAENGRILEQGGQIAFVIRKGALEYQGSIKYANDSVMVREDVLRRITEYAGTDPIVSTTGKTSRELFEIRESRGESHGFDFLTVGSMGHSSSIAAGIAANAAGHRIWCIDGDGAALMHMGSMAVIGSMGLKNLVHVVLNNRAHESVGGMPTVSGNMDFPAVAKACGYRHSAKVDTFEKLDLALLGIKGSDGPYFLEVDVSIGSRPDLGRPTTTPVQNRDAFMEHLKTL